MGVKFAWAWAAEVVPGAEAMPDEAAEEVLVGTVDVAVDRAAAAAEGTVNMADAVVVDDEMDVTGRAAFSTAETREGGVRGVVTETRPEEVIGKPLTAASPVVVVVTLVELCDEVLTRGGSVGNENESDWVGALD